MLNALTITNNYTEINIMGTHDVSVLSLDGGIFEVKSTSGDSHLG